MVLSNRSQSRSLKLVNFAIANLPMKPFKTCTTLTAGGTLIFAFSLMSPQTIMAFGAYGTSGLAGGYRWDAAPRSVSGWERSLDGGLRYSLQGGSWQAYRDSFAWSSVPSVADFQSAVQSAFGFWQAVDPVSSLGTMLSFNLDLATPVNATVSGNLRLGAEIDLFAFNFGDTGLHADTFFNAGGSTVKLTSGTVNYVAGAIQGADVRMNANPSALWTLQVFKGVLTHEIGHSIGLADVDTQAGPGGYFIDDNYNGSTSATALSTLTNPFAHLINILNPAASAGLSTYFVANGNPGVDTPGVEIMMESAISGFLIGNPGLRNDDFAGRQFLYPIPEPATATLLGLGVLALLYRKRNSRSL